MSKAPIGGQIMVLSATLPTIGPGALKNREDPKILGTSKVCNSYLPRSPMSNYGCRNLTCCKLPRHFTKPLPSNVHERKSPLICSCSVLRTKMLQVLVNFIILAIAHATRLIQFDSLSASLYIWPDIFLSCLQRCAVGGCCQVRT